MSSRVLLIFLCVCLVLQSVGEKGAYILHLASPWRTYLVVLQTQRRKATT